MDRFCRWIVEHLFKQAHDHGAFIVAEGIKVHCKDTVTVIAASRSDLNGVGIHLWCQSSGKSPILCFERFKFYRVAEDI
jgi:hypothetical protein